MAACPPTAPSPAQPSFLFNPPPSRASPPIPGLPGARLPPVPLSTPCPPSPNLRGPHDGGLGSQGGDVPALVGELWALLWW